MATKPLFDEEKFDFEFPLFKTNGWLASGLRIKQFIASSIKAAVVRFAEKIMAEFGGIIDQEWLDKEIAKIKVEVE